MQLSALAKRAWLLLFTAIGGFYLWGLGSLPLVGPDEPRYAEVAREMLARRDVITPTLGGLPWFEKPPLLYWLMMISYRVLGVNEYAARLGPALCGLLTAGFVYLIGRCVDEVQQQAHNHEPWQIGRWSALVWLSSLGAIGFSRGATFDIVLTMTISAALACFFVAEVKDRATVLLLVAFYIFVGLSLLAKGLIGFVIIFAALGFYFMLRREWPRKTFLISLTWGVPFSIAIAGVWYGPMLARHGWTFIDQFIIQHHFARFVTNKYHHRGPFYFYLPVLIGLALPWSIVLAASLISSHRWNWRGQLPLDRARVLAFAWLIVPVVFFSFSESKLPAYILPALPAVAVLVGDRIACFCRESRGDKVLRLTGAFLIVVAGAAAWYLHRDSSVPLASLLFATSHLILLGGLAIALARFRVQIFLLISIVTLGTAVMGVRIVAPSVAKRESVRDLLAVAAARGYANTPVVQLETLERTVEFYAAGRISYGGDADPEILETMPQLLNAARQNDGVVLCFARVELAPLLVKSKLADSEIISDNGRTALLVVHSK